MNGPTETAIRFRARLDYREEGRLDGYAHYPPGSTEQAIYCDEAAVILEHERSASMGLMASDTGGDFIEQAPAGNHVAVCYQIIDLGMKTQEWEGKQRTVHRVRISWELAEELMADGRPYSISEYYTLSLAQAANLRAALESWRGRPFTPEELQGFDLKAILGVPCMVNVIHEPSKKYPGRIKAIVSSITPIPRGLTRPVASNPLFFFSLSDADAIQKYNAMEDWLKNMINIESLRARMPPGSAANPTTPPATYDDFNDDIPF